MSEARDVLREAILEAYYSDEYDDFDAAILDAVLAHPVELLALLAEPKACAEPECGMDGDTCPSCHGSGSVKVDVLADTALALMDEVEALREALRVILATEVDADDVLDVYRALVDARLAARAALAAVGDTEEPCATCGGAQWVNVVQTAVDAFEGDPCPSCGGGDTEESR